MRVLIVEDSGYLAEALTRLLEMISGFTIVGRASNMAEAISLAVMTKPDLTVLDLQIKDTPYGDSKPDYGVATLRELQQLNPKPKVMVLSAMPEYPWLQIVAQEGAIGFVSKDSDSQEIIAALESVSAGRLAFTPAQWREIQLQPLPLSQREREVLRLLDEGLSNQDIADRLHISVGTVRKHVEHLRDRFGVKNRGQVVAAARRERLL